MDFPFDMDDSKVREFAIRIFAEQLTSSRPTDTPCLPVDRLSSASASVLPIPESTSGTSASGPDDGLAETY